MKPAWVAIVSFPKSGNTWMRLALRALLNGGALDDLTDIGDMSRAQWLTRIFNRVTGVRAEDLTLQEICQIKPQYLAHALSSLDRFSLIKMHDAARDSWGNRILAPELQGIVLHLVRDPRDVAPSWANHGGNDLDTTIAKMADSDQFLGVPHGGFAPMLPQYLGSWSSHVQSWDDEAEKRPVLTIRYEDHITDPEGVLQMVADRIGISCDKSDIRAAVEATRFDRLAEMEQANGFSERPVTSNVFFRSGRSGGWQNTLSPSQVAAIEAAHGDVMKKWGYVLSSKEARS